MLNGVNKKKIQKTNNIKVNNYLGTLSKDILDKIDYLLKNNQYTREQVTSQII